MAHVDLLALIKPMTNDDAIFMKDALIAVVEFHKPMLWKNLDNDTSGYQCQGCTWGLYPCPTIQAIEKELG
jgi:hypothetical protein